MALKEYFGENRNNEILNKVERLVSEFKKLPKLQNLKLFWKNENIRKRVQWFTRTNEWSFIENNGLQEENQMFKRTWKT